MRTKFGYDITFQLEKKKRQLPSERLEGGGSTDLDLAQTVRILMKKQRITEETQRLMRENQ